MSVDEFLSTLSPAELQEVRTKSLFLLRQDSSRTVNVEEELYDQVRDYLGNKGVAIPPYSVFSKKSPKAAAFAAAAVQVRQFTDQYLRPRGKLERLRAYDILLRTVDHRIVALQIPRSFQAVLTFLPKIPGLIELEFPGYLESGLLPQILLRHRRA